MSMMKEPERNGLSTDEAKIDYVLHLITEARKTGDAKIAWKLVDFLHDTALIEELM